MDWIGVENGDPSRLCLHQAHGVYSFFSRTPAASHRIAVRATHRLADPVAESTNTSWLQTLASGGRSISGGQEGGSLCLHSSVCTTTLATPEPNTYIAGSAWGSRSSSS